MTNNESLPAAAASPQPCEDSVKLRAVRGRLHRASLDGNQFAMTHLRDFDRLHTATANGGDWDADAAHENGKYQCRCCNCGNLFIGHKRRVTCKTCVDLQGALANATPQATTKGLE